MVISRINPTTDPRWQRLTETHPEASIFHSAEWLRALQRTYGYEPVAYVGLGSGGELVSGMPFCLLRSRFTGRRQVSLPFSDHCQPLLTNGDELKELLSIAQQDSANNHCKYIEIRPLAL